MLAFEWTYEFRGRALYWFISISFLLVGIGLCCLAWFLPRENMVLPWAVALGGAVFFLIGLIVCLMTIKKLPDHVIQTVGGMLGALSFGIPATFVLPGLWLAYSYRPNALLGAQDAFGSDQWFIGIVFSVFGILTTVGTIALARYQLKQKNVGWSWHWEK